MTIISEFTGSPAIPVLGLKTVDLKLEVHSFQTDFRDLQTLDRIFRPVFGFGTRVYRGISCCSAGLSTVDQNRGTVGKNYYLKVLSIVVPYRDFCLRENRRNLYYYSTTCTWGYCT